MIATGYVPRVGKMDDFTGRAWVLPLVSEWLFGSRQRLGILVGPPGFGKSMLTAWLAGDGPEPTDAPAAESLGRIREAVRGVFFCTAGTVAPVSALTEALLGGFSRTLSGYSDACATALRERGESATVIQNVQRVGGRGKVIGAILHLGSPEQEFDHLVRRPLALLAGDGRLPERVLCLVDAIDESRSNGGEDSLVRLLKRLDELPPAVRLLCTCRDDAARVVNRFPRPSRIDLRTLKDDDVERYARSRLAALGADVSGRLAAAIAGRSRGVFLYAALVVEQVLVAWREGRWRLGAPLPAVPDGLPGFYHEFLTRELTDDYDRWLRTYKPLLGVIAVARGRGLTTRLLKALAIADVDSALGTLKQYFDGALPEGPFRVFHESFARFLTGPENSEFPIPAREAHGRLARHLRVAGDWGGAYGLDHLAAHLRLSGLGRKLFALLRSGEWTRAKLARDPSGAELVRDYAEGWAYGRAVSRRQIRAGRPALGLARELEWATASAQVRSRVGGVPPALLRALVEFRVWDLANARLAAEHVPAPGDRTEAYLALAGLPDLSAEDRADFLQAARRAADRVSAEEQRVSLLWRVAVALPAEARSAAEADAATALTALTSLWQRHAAIEWLAEVVPDGRLKWLIDAIDPKDAIGASRALGALGPRLAVLGLPLGPYLRARAATRAQGLPPALAFELPDMPAEQRRIRVEQGLADLPGVYDLAGRNQMARALVPWLEADQLEAVPVALRPSGARMYEPNEALMAVARRCVELKQGKQARKVANTVAAGWLRIMLAEQFAEAGLATAAELLEEFRRWAGGRDYLERWHFAAVGALARFLPEAERASRLREAAARSQEAGGAIQAEDRILTLGALATVLPSRQDLLAKALDEVSQLESDSTRYHLLAGLAPLLGSELAERAFERVKGMTDDGEVEVVAALAHHATPALQDKMISSLSSAQGDVRPAVSALAEALGESLLDLFLAMACGLDPEAREQALRSLARRHPERVPGLLAAQDRRLPAHFHLELRLLHGGADAADRAELLKRAEEIVQRAGTSHLSDRVCAAAAWALGRPGAEGRDTTATLAWLARIANEQVKTEVFVGVFDGDDSPLPTAVAVAAPDHGDWEQISRRLSVLPYSLTRHRWQELAGRFRPSRKGISDRVRCRALTILIRHWPRGHLPTAVLDWACRAVPAERVVAAPSDLWEWVRDFAALVSAHPAADWRDRRRWLHRRWYAHLRTAADGGASDVLGVVRLLAPVVAALGGEEGTTAVFDFVDQLARPPFGTVPTSGLRPDTKP